MRLKPEYYFEEVCSLIEEELMNDLAKDAKSFESICKQRYSILGYSPNAHRKKK